MRFAAKGGIGSAVGLTDKLAQPESNELMFMDGEDLIVLMHLEKQVYLGCCEGVVGIFHEQDVRFTSKLKKPVFTKSASSTLTSNGAAPSPSTRPSVAPAHKRSSSAESATHDNGTRSTPREAASDVQSPKAVQEVNGHPDTLDAPALKRRSRSWSPVRDSPQHNLDRLLSQASLYQEESQTTGNDSTQSSLDRDVLTPDREELDYPLTPLNQTGERWHQVGDIDMTPMAVEAENREQAKTHNTTFTLQTAGLTKRQTRRLGMASPLTSPVGAAFNVEQTRQIASGLPVTSNRDDLEQSGVAEELPRHSIDSVNTPATDTEQFILDSYEYSAPSPVPGSSNTFEIHEVQSITADDPSSLQHRTGSKSYLASSGSPPRETDISLSGGSVASLIRRRMESNSRSPYSESPPLPLLDAPLQIHTGKSPALEQAEQAQTSLQSDPEPSPALSLRSPTTSTMPNLPQGVSLKQLRASPGSSFSFPRRSPHSNNMKAPPIPRRAASGPSPVVDAASSSNSTLVSLDNGHKASDRLQSIALGKTLSQPASPASSLSQVRLESPASFAYRVPPKPPQTSFRPPATGTSSPSASSFHSEQYSPGLGTEKHGGFSFPSTGANPRPRVPNSPLHKFRPLHNGHDNHAVHGGQVGPASPTDYFGTVLSPVTSTSSHGSDRSPTKMRHSRSFSGLSGLTRASSVLNRRRPSLPNGSVHADNRKEPSINSQTEAVVHLGNTEFEFVQPNLPKTSLGDSLGAGSLFTINNTLAESTLESPLERPSTDRLGAMSVDYDTDADGGNGLLHSTLVTRPSEAAKARVRSIYIEDQYIEPSYLAARFAPSVPIQEDEGDLNMSSNRLSEEEQPAAPDARALEAHRARELKWVQVMNQMSASSAKKSKKVKRLVSYGIPSSVRGKAWTFLAEVDTYRRQNVYHDLCGREAPSYQAELERDLDQTFANQPHFNGENGLARHDLLSIMRAFAHYAPDIGYHRGLCSIAGILLLHVEAETAFWLLVSIVKTHLVGYYTAGMQGFRVDAFVLYRLVKSSEPKLHQALETAGIDPEAFASAWFLPLFVNTLPWPSLLRIVDSLLYSDQSSKFIIRVGLSILDLLRDTLLSADGNMLPILLNPPQDLLNPPSLLPTVFTVKVPERTLRKYSKLAETSLDASSSKIGRQRSSRR